MKIFKYITISTFHYLNFTPIPNPSLPALPLWQTGPTGRRAGLGVIIKSQNKFSLTSMIHDLHINGRNVTSLCRE